MVTFRRSTSAAAIHILDRGIGAALLREQAATMTSAELCGVLRRIRRTADMSQREFAVACGVAQSVIAHAESGRRGLTAHLLARATAVAGLRVALLDADGAEVRPMDDGAVRDMGGRRFPAHLDTRYSEEAWWHGEERYSRPEPWYTFDRARDVRDRYRARDGTPDDHQLPRPGDSPDERRAARARAARERRRAAASPSAPQPWTCDCPPLCAELEDWEGPPKHAAECECRCDPC
jgi:transcriptional regulator with XRE-family HTH domain